MSDTYANNLSLRFNCYVKQSFFQIHLQSHDGPDLISSPNPSYTSYDKFKALRASHIKPWSVEWWYSSNHLTIVALEPFMVSDQKSGAPVLDRLSWWDMESNFCRVTWSLIPKNRLIFLWSDLTRVLENRSSRHPYQERSSPPVQSVPLLPFRRHEEQSEGVEL